MRIHIKTSEGKVINIPVPLSLALIFIKKGALNIGKEQLKDAAANPAENYADEEVKAAESEEDDGSSSDDAADKEDVKKLIKGLKDAKKQWGHLKIVEVLSADGEEVVITL